MEALQGTASKSGRQVATSGRQPQLAKGIVKVGTDKGWLRLRWTHQGKRYALTLGLPDSKTNRVHAQQQASRIELDIISGNFDPSLKKYKPASKRIFDETSVGKLFEEFIRFKSKAGLSDRTLDKYRATLKHLNDFFGEKLVIHISGPESSIKFAEYLPTKVGPVAVKTYLTLISACWSWGLKNGYVECNPWEGLVSGVKVPPKEPPKPFSREEIGAITLGFRSDQHYHHYADYVEFLFGTGCRTGEAIGLRWKHLADDCSMVWIGESLSRGVRKSTKTNKARTITLTPKLQAMLLARRLINSDPDGLVFTSPTGKPIDDHNFRNRAWKTILTRLEIEYRKPYTTRSTLISHALDLGMSPVMVA